MSGQHGEVGSGGAPHGSPKGVSAAGRESNMMKLVIRRWPAEPVNYAIAAHPSIGYSEFGSERSFDLVIEINRLHV